MNLSEVHKQGVLEQTDTYWQKLCAVLVFKNGPQELTLEDFARFNALMEGEKRIFFTHGHAESIELALITKEEANRRAAKTGELHTLVQKTI
jgi:hypothetical protein